uniref:Secreted protein n=1 Tax=Mesocestoides corti TaxID=53468 RepID=A0A5K3FVC7_MESCO
MDISKWQKKLLELDLFCAILTNLCLEALLTCHKKPTNALKCVLGRIPQRMRNITTHKSLLLDLCCSWCTDMPS